MKWDYLFIGEIGRLKVVQVSYGEYKEVKKWKDKTKQGKWRQKRICR